MRTFFSTKTATRTNVFLYVTCLFLNGYVKVSDEPFNRFNFTIREDTDLFVLGFSAAAERKGDRDYRISPLIIK